MQFSSPARDRLCAALSSLLCALALAGTAFAQHPSGAEAGAATRHPALGNTTYRVVNLAPGDMLRAAVNIHGQVAYSVVAPGPGPLPGPVSNWFYDGNRSIRLDLGVLGLNDAGQVLGLAAFDGGPSRAYIWTRRGGFTDLGLLPGTIRINEAYINNRGVVAGSASGPPEAYVNRAFRWSASRGMTDLGTLGQGPFGVAYVAALNDAGAITGNAWAFGADYHAFLWTYGSSMVDIHTNTSNDSRPTGISAAGHVSGNYHVDGFDDRGFIWTPKGGMRDLNPGGVGTVATGMSASGQIIGLIGTQETGRRAMSWTRAGGLRDLGTFGGTTSVAAAVNNLGQVIGYAETAVDGQFRAFAWTARDSKIDLNTRLRRAPAGLQLNMAVAVSDNGDILARSNAGLVLLKPVRGQPCGCPHTVGPIVAGGLVPLGAPFEASVSVAGESAAAAYRVTWDWGNGSTVRVAQATGDANAGAERRSSASHSYVTPGIHTVTADVADAAGKRVSVSRRIVAYAPSSGTAAGAGAFTSRTLGSAAAPVQAGIARFSFIVPAAGQTRAGPQPALYFDLGSLSLISTDIRPVARQGARGQFAGSGMVNGKEGYRFTLAATASDAARGEPGRVWLKIWQTDPGGKETVVYDSGSDRGNGKWRASERDRATVATAASSAGASGGNTLAEGAIALQ